MIFYGKNLSVYKVNCHTHTTTSDGFFTPEQIVSMYAARGYDALFLTDHRKTNDVSRLNGGKMRVFSGIELHPRGPRGIVWHLLGLGVPPEFDGEPGSGQEAIDRINAGGGVAFVAHPYWCGFTSAEVMSLRGAAGIEVYNTSTRYIGKEYNMQLWDEMLDAGANPAALAVDDIHFHHDLFRGWTMICAGENSPEAILSALKTGAFYATQGPEFYRLSLENGIFEAEFSAVESAILLSNQSRGFCVRAPGDPFPDSTGTVTRMKIDVSGLPPGSYLRCQIRDAFGRYGWTNPVRVGQYA